MGHRSLRRLLAQWDRAEDRQEAHSNQQDSSIVRLLLRPNRKNAPPDSLERHLDRLECHLDKLGRHPDV